VVWRRQKGRGGLGKTKRKGRGGLGKTNFFLLFLSTFKKFLCRLGEGGG